ncbi:MAG: SAM-dependent chlorinase/fluorinase, partial [Kiloniellales bacterium]|nr:SAM-dependent chlorinase/fluorinase [Kiloniellales bacterium]
MILLLTDFGRPYTAQMLAAIHRIAPNEKALVLFDDLPSFNPKAAGHLIEAYCSDFPEDSIFCCVVDPGVGSPRSPLVVRAKDRWFLGPDNGLFACLLSADETAQAWIIDWRPEVLSPSFHGRDLFAPFAAKLAREGEGILGNAA